MEFCLDSNQKNRLVPLIGILIGLWISEIQASPAFHVENLPLDGPIYPVWDQLPNPEVKDVQEMIIKADRVGWVTLTNPILPLQKGPHWARLVLSNTSKDVETVIWEDQWASTNFVDVYLVQGHEVLIHAAGGDYRPEIKPAFQHRYPAFVLKIPPGTSTLYVRYESDDIPGVRAALWHVKAFEDYRIAEMLKLGIMLGILVVMAFYNLIIYIFVRIRAYLHYAVYVASFLAFEICIQGLGFLYIWPSSWINGEATLITAMLALVFALQFADQFLDLEQHFPTSRPYGRILQYLCWTNIIGTCISLQFGNLFGIIVDLLGVTWIMTITVHLAFRRHMQAYAMLCAWGVFLAGNGWSMLYFVGIVPPGWGGRWAMLLGADFEAVTLSLGLAQHMARLRREKTQAELSEAKVLANIEAATKFQEVLLGPTQPSAYLQVATFFQPAERMGGDWYDIVSMAEDRYVFVFVGDVTGHGLSSTLLSSAVSGCIRATLYALEEDGVINPTLMLRDIAQRSNRLIYESGSREGWLMSMILVCLDLCEQKVWYLNAGHPHPCLMQNAPHFLVSKGSLLGLSPDPEFEVKEHSMRVGDTLVLCTDGVFECETHSHEMLSQKAFTRLLSQDPKPDAIVGQLKSLFVTTRVPQADDITLVAIELVRSWQDASVDYQEAG